MELTLTGDMLSAHDAERAGLVSRVVPDAEVVATAIAIGDKIAKCVRACVKT